jgi:PhnB protein
MVMNIQAYLNFDGRCEEAAEYYKANLGAKINMLLRFKDNPEVTCAASAADKVMHMELQIGDTTLLASDCNVDGKPEFKGISLALRLSQAEAQRAFTALADGGQVFAPLSKTFFSPSFGVVSDRFGVSWMIVANA